jgi:RNA polymerase sigma factor for flagellar operon FliA
MAENSNFNLISDNKELQPEVNLLEDELKRTLLETVDALPEKEKLVMQLYYYSELTYKEISYIMEISESRISQIHSKAIAKLKVALNRYNNC